MFKKEKNFLVNKNPDVIGSHFPGVSCEIFKNIVRNWKSKFKGQTQ